MFRKTGFFLPFRFPFLFIKHKKIYNQSPYINIIIDTVFYFYYFFQIFNLVFFDKNQFMTFLLAIFLGLIISIGGIIIPGMLNMTIAKISIKESQKQALNFALGAVVVVFIQSFLGTYFAKFLDANPVFSEGLKKIGTFIFIALTIAFAIMGFNSKKKKEMLFQMKILFKHFKLQKIFVKLF